MADEKWDPDFWQNKRVLITGHTGFIGSWLSHWLLRRGAKVAGLACAPHTSPALYDLLGLEQKLSSTIADMCDRKALAALVDSHRPQIVIHLAAQAIVGQAHADAYETWRVNALGTVALLEALRGRSELKALSIFTTDKVYDNLETGRAHTEGDPIGGLGIYDSSKGAAELAVRAFVHGRCVSDATATLRAGNVIGGGDWNDARLVPDCARAFAKDMPVTLRHPQSIRPWQHVLDVCHATLLLTEKLFNEPARFSGPWNIGPDSEHSASAADIATQLAAHWKINPPWQKASDASDFHEAVTLRIDASKLKTAIDWQPVLSLSDAVQWTALWYQAYAQQPDQIAAFTDDQISAFERRLR
jgi:CDP-glucose 4,6-dehydratase